MAETDTFIRTWSSHNRESIDLTEHLPSEVTAEHQLIEEVLKECQNLSKEELEAFWLHFRAAAVGDREQPGPSLRVLLSELEELAVSCNLQLESTEKNCWTRDGVREALQQHRTLMSTSREEQQKKRTGKSRWALACRGQEAGVAGGEDVLSLTFAQFAKVVSIAHRNELEPRKMPVFPFDPDSGPKQIWDGIVMFFLMYTTFSVPYMLSFGAGAGDTSMDIEWGVFDVFDLFLDVLFCIDVVINFCTAYTSRGVYITSMKAIAIHYCGTWFLLDFFGSVPFDKIVTAITQGSGGFQGVLQAMRLVRILKIVRAVRFLQKLNQLEQKDTTGTVKSMVSIFRAVFLMVFVAHFLACIFYLMIDKSVDSLNWMTAFDESMLDFDETSNGQRYILGFYWAIITICTVGYGDILPVTHEERIFALIAALIGGICFSYSLGSITQLIQKSSGSNKRFEDKLTEVREYLEFRCGETNVRRHVLSYYGRSWRVSGEMYKELDLISLMPAELRANLLRNIAKDAQQKVPFLKGMEDLESLGNIFIRLRPHSYEENEYIYRQRDRGEEMIFIEKGSAQIERMPTFGVGNSASSSEAPQHPFEHPEYTTFFKAAFEPISQADWVATNGDTFGEMCLFPHICKYRYENAKATAPTTCFLLTHSSLDELQIICPPFVNKLHDLCKVRAAIYGVSNQAFEAVQHGKQDESALDIAVREYQAELMAVYEKGISAALSKDATLSKSAARNHINSSPTRTLAKSRSQAVSEMSSMSLFRCWILGEGRARDAGHDTKWHCDSRATASQRTAFNEDARQKSYMHGYSNATHIPSHTAQCENAGQHTTRWSPICLSVSVDGKVIAVYNDVDSLVREGPTCLGRVVAMPSPDAGFEVREMWPLIGGDLVDGVRNTGLTFCVEEEEEVHRAHPGFELGSMSSNRRSCNGYGHMGTHSIAAVGMAGAGQVRYISVSMGKETASRLAVVLENCVAAYDVKSKVPIAPVRHLSSRTHTSDEHANALPAMRYSLANIEVQRAMQQQSEREKQHPQALAQSGNTGMRASKAQGELETPMQELLRKMSEMQQQMSDLSSVKDDVRELKAALGSRREQGSTLVSGLSSPRGKAASTIGRTGTPSAGSEAAEVDYASDVRPASDLCK